MLLYGCVDLRLVLKRGGRERGYMSFGSGRGRVLVQLRGELGLEVARGLPCRS